MTVGLIKTAIGMRYGETWSKGRRASTRKIERVMRRLRGIAPPLFGRCTRVYDAAPSHTPRLFNFKAKRDRNGGREAPTRFYRIPVFTVPLWLFLLLASYC